MQGEDHALEGSMWALSNGMGSPWRGCQQHPRRSGSQEGEPALVLQAKQRAGDGARPGPLPWSRRLGQTRLPTCVSEQELKEVWHSAPLQLGEPLRP